MNKLDRGFGGFHGGGGSPHVSSPVVRVGGSGRAWSGGGFAHVNHGGRFFRGQNVIFSNAWPIYYPDAYWPLYYPTVDVAPTNNVTTIDLGPKGVLALWAVGNVTYWSLNGSPWQATSVPLNFNVRV